MEKILSEKEFESIVSNTRGIVLSAVSRTLRSEYYDAIDDVAQNTYLRLYKSLVAGKFRGEAKMETYLYVIARNESIRMNAKLTREKRKAEKLISFTRKEDFIMEDKNEDNKNAVETALLSLPEPYRDVMACAMENLSTTETAVRLGIPLGTVKSRSKRGRDMLRKILEGESYERPFKSEQ